jgi:hypothetical protein
MHAGMSSTSPLCVELAPLASIDTLATEWRALEALSTASFFLSWNWIQPLLQALPGNVAPHVLRISDAGRCVALALMWRRVHWRHGFVRSRAWYLHETGLPAYDRLTMEHNGLLSERGREAEAIRALTSFLANRDDWDELHLPGLVTPVHAMWALCAEAALLKVVPRWTKRYHWVDLTAVRGSNGQYLDSLSSNTRYQIRRAIKHYSAFGPLVCERPISLEQAQRWFSELVALHQAYWVGKGLPGAFGSEFTLRFHDALIRSGWEQGVVQLSRISVGSARIGYVYNFRRGDTLYNYQSGHVDEADGKRKPGLVCHALVVAQAMEDGLSVYDMLMGGDHYKASLTSSSGDMHWLVLQKRRLVLMLESALRHWKNRKRAFMRDSDSVTAQRDRVERAL